MSLPHYRLLMENDLAPQLEQLDVATAGLLVTARGFTDDDVRGPSLLEGWTRGHVLTHVARHADAMRNLLVWARTGEPTPAYASSQERDAGIEAGAGRGAQELADDVAESGRALREAVVSLPDEAWDHEVRILDRPPFPARQILARRLVEVELHHVDLDAGYTADHWPASFLGLEVDERLHAFRLDRIAWAARPGAGRGIG